MAIQISSPSNPMIKLARHLRQRKGRNESDLFFVEGILHVGEAASAGWKFEALFFCPERLKSEFAQQLVEKLAHENVKCIRVSEETLESFSEKDNPQGISAIVRQNHRKLDDLAKFELLVAVVSPQDPGNVGTILRTIDSVGADGLILIDGGVDPYHPSAVRASMGAIFWKPLYSINFLDFLRWSKEQGVRIIGTSSHAEHDYRKVRLDERPTVLLLGSEQKGLLPEQLAACTDLIALPMCGKATSLNLSVAAGIFLYSLKT